MNTYAQHIQTIEQRWHAALAANGFDAAVIVAGARQNYFLDDQAPPYRANPHLAQWLDGAVCEHALLLIRPGHKPRLYFLRPRDYWHQPPSIPDVAGLIEIETYETPDSLISAACRHLEKENRIALIGETVAPTSNLPVAEENPQQLLNHLHYQRAYKTGYEIDCMTRATRTAVRGHGAALASFRAGASEFEIHQAYLGASRQTEIELPYSNIVALNEHAAVLHYQHYDRMAPEVFNSFLIDAGGRDRGFASDITRTYAADAQPDFAALIAALDAKQQALIQRIRPGMNFVDLHDAMHRDIGDLLAQFDIVSCSSAQAYELGITDTFFPHGLGHLIGLQTHDVAGHLISPDGGIRVPPARYPTLRLTRDVEKDQVFTIEPGLYFIPLLLDALRAGPHGRHVNWTAVAHYLPCGGIRIEDNVRVGSDGITNLTRIAFAEALAAADAA